MKILTGLLSVLVLVACAQKAPEGTFVQNEAGVVVTPATGSAKRVRLEVRGDHIVRVTAVAENHRAIANNSTAAKRASCDQRRESRERSKAVRYAAAQLDCRLRNGKKSPWNMTYVKKVFSAVFVNNHSLSPTERPLRRPRIKLIEAA